MQKVRMKTTVAGPDGAYQAGGEYSVPAALAELWSRAGAAIKLGQPIPAPVEAEPQPEPEAEVETAAKEPQAEKAVSKAARRKKRA